MRAYILPALGKVPLADLRPSNLQAFYLGSLDKGLSASTVSQLHRILSKVLSDAVKMELVARNVTRAVTPPRARRKEMRCLAQEEMLRLLKEAQSTPYYAVFYTALFTGLRRSELLGLRWRDLDLDMGTLSVAQTLHSLEGGRLVFSEPKSQKGRRTVALSPSLAVLLRQHREAHEKARALLDVALKEDDLVFAWLDGRPMLPDSVSHAWEKLVNRLGLKGIRLHDTRHTHASLMLAQGIHPKIVSERLGHSTVALTLDIYSHVLPGLQEAAAKRFEEGLFTQPVSKPLAEIPV